MRMRVSRKLGMPLKRGEAARCRRLCSMPRYSPRRSTLVSTCCLSTSSFQSWVNVSSFPSRWLRISLNIHGRPKVARPTMMASTPYCSKHSRARSGDVMSPLPMMGMCMRGLRFTSPMSVQSASPVYICERVRPCMVRALMPQSCSCSASSTMMRWSWSHPRRVFTVTGVLGTASTTVRVISSMRGIFCSIPAPAPLPATRLTGQPKLMSSMSGRACSTTI